MEKEEDFYDIINKEGLDIFDNIIVPFFSAGIKAKLPIIEQIITFKNNFAETKIELFVKYMNAKGGVEIKERIKSMNQDDKIFMLSAITKTMDMDDNLQIYILSCLTKIYLENSGLNYYEKSLFYNISQFSEDDFLIFYEKISTLKSISSDKDNIVFYDMSNCSETEEIILRKFMNIGILKHDLLRVGSGKNFQKTEYTDQLMEFIYGYKTN